MHTVLIIQLVLPLMIGIPAILWSERFSGRGSAGSTTGGSAYGAVQLEPLQCPHCSAPVPLRRDGRSSSCGR